MPLTTILMLVLIVALFAALPNWGWSNNWGYAPSGGLGLILVVLVILIVMGQI